MVILTSGGRGLSAIADPHPDVDVLTLSGPLTLSSLRGVEAMSSALFVQFLVVPVPTTRVQLRTVSILTWGFRVFLKKPRSPKGMISRKINLFYNLIIISFTKERSLY